MTYEATTGRGSHLTLRTRLGLGYGGILLVFVILAALNVYQFNRLVEANQVLERETRTALAAEELSRASLELVAAIDEAIILKDSSYFSSVVPPARKELDDRLEAMRALIADPTTLNNVFSRLTGFVNPMVAQARSGNWDLIQSSRITRLGEAIGRMSEEVDLVVRQAQGNQARALQEASLVQGALVRNLVWSLLIALLLSILMVVTTIRGITRQIHVLTDASNRLAGGHLEQRVPVESNDEFGQMAVHFNRMAAQLQTLYSQLERRILERTQRLQDLTDQMRASAEVGQAATTILDPNVLMDRVVELISQRFGFYHAGIFLMDAQGQFAILQAASSPGGKRMLARNHRLEIGQGIVGYAAQQEKPHTAQDVGSDAVFFDNPDLPDTRSEAALPLVARSRILGVLDVQSTQASAFTPENIAVLQNMADQIALALDNASLYHEATTRLSEMHRAASDYSRDAWNRLLKSRQGLSYRYSEKEGVSRAFLDPEGNGGVDEQVDETEIIERPVRVRDQVIGTMKVRLPGSDGGWAPDRMTALDALSEQLGIALESARLYSETQEQAERERLVGAITAHMRESLDVETVVKVAVEEIYQALGLESMTVLLSPDLADASDQPLEEGAQEIGTGRDDV